MYFDLEDYRPDTPRAPSAISWREGVLLSIIAHLVLVVAVLMAPPGFFAVPLDRPQPVNHDPATFVEIVAPPSRPAPPKPTAEPSNLDRRSATPEPVPQAENPMPVSRGNTPEKLVGAPDERAAAAPAPPSMAPPDLAAKVLPLGAADRSASGSLGDALRNMKKYLQDQNFDNAKGGRTDQGAGLSFDERGVEFGPWKARFLAQVRRNWSIPEAAMFSKGHVVLQLYVQKDGTITGIRVVQPTAIESLNSAAFYALKLSNPTMPLPSEYPADGMQITITFYYNEIIR
jgi:TonB family protein